MVQVKPVALTDLADAQRKGRPSQVTAWMRRRPLDAAAVAFALLLLVAALLLPFVAPYEPAAQHIQARLGSPSAAHWMGTDHLGRDVFSRVLYAARLSIIVGFGSVALGAGIGGTIGVVSGAANGKLDMAIQRVVDILMSFPLLVLALAIIVTLGASVQATVLALAIAYAPLATRITRSVALSERGQAHIDAAKALGASHLRIALRHIAPASFAPWLVLASAEVGGAMLTEASLSFLGLGAQEPLASLGSMLGGSALSFVDAAPWMALWPGLVLAALVLSFNLAGDALRDLLDVKERAR